MRKRFKSLKEFNNWVQFTTVDLNSIIEIAVVVRG